MLVIKVPKSVDLGFLLRCAPQASLWAERLYYDLSEVAINMLVIKDPKSVDLNFLLRQATQASQRAER